MVFPRFFTFNGLGRRPTDVYVHVQTRASDAIISMCEPPTSVGLLGPGSALRQ